ncbi:N-acetyltransferase [Hanamia caeni]|uniref:N-acetyltransferase n=1 Tax=Hanamia caeni TaxID=2294116 RepID=A0A3M9N676_9BACT|nr:GNAT family N-acetyltransferase [Hanamia caeni]RNI32713.1 N-acetyltransferase [Hanamia caeni]
MIEVNFQPFPTLTTSRLVLRKMGGGDNAQIFKLRADVRVMKYIGKKPMQTIAEADEFINLINDGITNNTGINWAMALKEDVNKLIGTIGLWRIIKEHYRAEIGYMLSPEYWRKGIGKEAILRIIDYGFNTLHLHSIEGKINPVNDASAKALESTGFIREALFKEDFFFNGQFEDTAIYSILNPNHS